MFPIIKEAQHDGELTVHDMVVNLHQFVSSQYLELATYFHLSLIISKT